MCELLSPQDGAVVVTLCDIYQRFIREAPRRVPADYDTADYQYKMFHPGIGRCIAVPLVFRGTGEIEVSDNAAFAHARRYRGRLQKDGTRRVSLYNLLRGATYYWRVAGARAYRSFRTDPAQPRFLYIPQPEICNVRDIGGWPVCRDGKSGRIRQGMLYRGVELDRDNILGGGAKRVLGALHIRTDLDLRGCCNEICPEQSALTGARRVFASMLAYGDVFKKEDYFDRLRLIFATLADAASYPVYVHCIGGADRTGTLVLMLDALLGLPYDDAVLEYELTPERTRLREDFQTLHSHLASLPGGCANYAENVERFLLGIGVPQAHLDAIRTLLTE